MTADGGDTTPRPDRTNEAERTALTRREQSLLVCIERALYRDDPSFVRRFERRSVRRRRRWFRRRASGG